MRTPIALETALGISPYVIAGGILLILLLLMLGLLMFGKGREHS